MRRRSFAAYALAVEGVAFFASLGALAAALMTASAAIRADFEQARRAEARKAELILDSFVERERRIFLGVAAAAHIPEPRFLAESFSDLYLVGKTGRVEDILLAEGGSAVYPGFELAFTRAGALLAEKPSEGCALSSIIRGVEDERPSIYLAAARNGGWIVARVRIERIVAELARFAEYRGEIIILAAADGRILASTRPELGIDLIPGADKRPITAFGAQWLSSERMNQALGDRIVVLSPRSELDRVLGAVRLVWPLLAGILLAAAALRTGALRRRALAPLGRFATALDGWSIDAGLEPPIEKSLLEFDEVAKLRHAFMQKSEEIRSAIGELKRREAEIVALNAELEERVRLRTASLERANAELATTNTRLSGTLRELKSTHKRLVDAEKLAAIGRLAAGTAHELNSPLGAIRSSAEHVRETLQTELKLLPDFLAGLGPDERNVFERLLGRALMREAEALPSGQRAARSRIEARLKLQGLPNADELAETLAEIGLESGDELEAALALPRLDAIVERLAALSSIERAARVIVIGAERAEKAVLALSSRVRREELAGAVLVDPIVGLEAAVALLRHKLGAVELIRDYERDALVFAQPRELEHVFANLLDNACDALSGQGRIELAIRKEGANVVVEVADTGPGIPDALQDRVFEPFFTTKSPEKGLGLGLHQCKKIVEAHGGTIGFISRPGRTVFVIRLPSASA